MMPRKIRRIENFYVTSHVEVNCGHSLSVITKRTINNSSNESEYN